MIITRISMASETLVYYYCVTSICDSTSISRIQRPLKACFRLVHDYDDDDDDDDADDAISGKL